MYKIETDEFMLRLKPIVHREDLREVVNTSLMIDVSSYDFSAKTLLDIDVRDLAEFAMQLSGLYERLSGSVRLTCRMSTNAISSFPRIKSDISESAASLTTEIGSALHKGCNSKTRSTRRS